MSSREVISEFRMSVFTALHRLRRYLQDNPGVEAVDAALSLKRADSDCAAADFDGALRLHSQLPTEIDFIDPVGSLRSSLKLLIEAHRPWWCRFIPYGRQRLATALTQDELQTFRSAGLFEELPSDDIVQWWDRLAALIRVTEDEKLSAQGRYAERLTMDYERKRLQSLGIIHEPRWIALEDNSAGYDVQSFEQTQFGLKNLLIEVKSSNHNPPQIFLTRNEWDVATQYGDAYVFHFWKLSTEELFIKPVSDIASHIPEDRDDGRWTEVKIQF